jgi:hypothetical protein
VSSLNGGLVDSSSIRIAIVLPEPIMLLLYNLLSSVLYVSESYVDEDELYKTEPTPVVTTSIAFG